MMKHPSRPRPWRHGLALLAATVVLIGCQSTPKAGPSAAELQALAFQEHLALSTGAINAGDLEQARLHLDEAEAIAATPDQVGKVRSLDRLITGAEALLAGDADGARDEWSQIEDPQLDQEVRDKAQLIGMRVP